MAVRSAVRSRVVVVLLGLLLLAIIGLPLTVKGDGTLTGEVRVLLSYTLGAVGVILAMATLWAGCAAVSLEVQQRQIQMILAKPVSRLEVWLGKWLGLMALNAALLLLCGVAVYGLLRWRTRTNEQRAEQILAASRLVLPDLSDLNQAAQRFTEQQLRAGQLPVNVPPDQLYQAVRDAFLRQANTVPEGARQRWLFRLPARPQKDQKLTIRYQFDGSKTEKVSVTGLWRVGPPEAAIPYEVRQTAETGQQYTLLVPASVVGSNNTVMVEYGNVNPSPVTVLFSPQEGVELLVPAGRFEGNFARSLAVMLCQLGFLAALAVTLGSLFSLPVAAFVTGALLILIKASAYIDSLAQSNLPIFGTSGPGAKSPDLVDVVMRTVFKVLAAVIRPLQETSPLENLASGQLVGWGMVGSVFAIKVVLYGGLLMVIGVWLFNRREIALPA